MKKLLIVFLVIIFALTGVPAALSVLPHGHGHDLDHSKHATCPVYQLSQICFAAQTVVFVSFFVFLVSRRYSLSPIFSPDFVLSHPLSLRGPPALR